MIEWHREQFGSVDHIRPVFVSRQGGGNRAMTRRMAHNILRDAFEKAGLNGNLAIRSIRNSYAQRLYEQTGNIYCVQKLLGHSSLNSTQTYLKIDINYGEVRQALEAMSLHTYREAKNKNK